MHTQLLRASRFRPALQFVERVRLAEREDPGLSAPQAAQVRSAAEVLAQLVSHSPHVAPCADCHRKGGLGAVQRNYLEVMDVDCYGLQFTGLPSRASL